jgi:sugar phosphate isomerase/epimerase
MTMRLQLGINNCFAVKRWPRAADWAPIVRERIGLRHVQVSLDLVDLESGDAAIASQAADVREATAAAGLHVHSTFTGLAAYSYNLLLHPEDAGRAAARAWYRRAIAFTSAVAAGGTGGHVGAFDVPSWHDPARRAALWADLKASLRDLSADARRAGQQFILVENLAAAREPSTIAQLRDLVTEGDDGHVPVVLCLDLGHQCVPGTAGDDRDPYAWLRQLGRLAPVIQLQQSDAGSDHHWPFTAARNREGRIDADRVVDALGEGGVEDALLALEMIPPFEQDDDEVLSDLVESAAYWRDALERRGVYAE